MFCFEITGRDAKLVIDAGRRYGTERLTLYRMLPQMGPPETTIRIPFPDNSWAEFDEFARAPSAGRHAAISAMPMPC
jgi:hypothetical protein